MSTQVQAQVKASPAAKPASAPMQSGLLQRKCACGGTPGVDGECSECRNKRLSLQSRATTPTAPSAVPPIVHDVLRSPGQSLDTGTRTFMESRFGHDFSKAELVKALQIVPEPSISTFAHGETSEFPGRLGKSPLVIISSTSKYTPLIKSSQPPSPPPQRPGGPFIGRARTVVLQPVFFKSSPEDPSPTGKSWERRLEQSKTIWSKLGVTFEAKDPKEIVNEKIKFLGNNRLLDGATIRSTYNGTDVAVFMMDNDLSNHGGGVTTQDDGKYIILSDSGSSQTILAHELGHVLGLGHPPENSDYGTIMVPGRSNDSNNPTRNTIVNYHYMTWPSLNTLTSLHPDP